MDKLKSLVPEDKSILVYIGIILIVIGLIYFTDFDPNTFWGGIRVEAGGFVLDVLFLGIVFTIYRKSYEKRREIKRYKEEIDDFRHWENEEAKFRIVGNIKRLNKLGVSDIDLSESFLIKARLSSAKLRYANLGLADLRGANLTGTDLRGANLFGAELSEADLYDADMSGATLWKTNLSSAKLLMADLSGAYLLEANLSGIEDLMIEQLLEVSTLYKATGLEPEIEKELREKKPELFNKPMFYHEDE